MPAPLRIAYLMEDTDLSGGVRVQLAQADALIARGHEVTIFTKGLPLTWRSSEADWEYVDDFRAPSYDGFDFVIATFWTTVAPAYERAGARALHLCQGLEFTFTAYQPIRAEIEAAYRLPVPKLVVSPHLEAWLAPFGQEVFVVGQIVDEEFYRSGPALRHEPPRVLLAGASQIDFKGIDVGYDAALHARAMGGEFDLVRVSPWAPAADEPKESAAEFHIGLDARAMARLVHSCEIFLGPSRKEEGFGLPAAEALAAGAAAVLSRIPSFESFDPERRDYALWADENDGIAMGDELVRLLDDEELRLRLGMRGRETVEKYRGIHIAGRIEAYLLDRRSRLE
ncbi:MAG TPA: glycosyltransferase [Thermoanaerobaculia bacterium]